MIRNLTNNTKLKHKKILKLTKGFYNRSHKTYKVALLKLYKALTYKTFFQKTKKRLKRALKTTQLNSFLNVFGGIKSSQFFYFISFFQIIFAKPHLFYFLINLEKIVTLFIFFKIFKIKIILFSIFQHFQKFFNKSSNIYYSFLLIKNFFKFTCLHQNQYLLNYIFLIKLNLTIFNQKYLFSYLLTQ